MKRNAKGQFVKGKGGRKASSSKRGKKRGKAMAHKRGHGSLESRVSRLEHGQHILAGAIEVIGREVAVHRRALVTGGLLSGRANAALPGGR